MGSLVEVLLGYCMAFCSSGWAACPHSPPSPNSLPCKYESLGTCWVMADWERAPTSGGQYHYVSMLAPLPYEKVLSYFTGKLMIPRWVATTLQRS